MRLQNSLYVIMVEPIGIKVIKYYSNIYGNCFFTLFLHLLINQKNFIWWKLIFTDKNDEKINFLIYMIGISTDLCLKMLCNAISLKPNSLKKFTLKYSHVSQTLNCAIEGLFFGFPCNIKLNTDLHMCRVSCTTSVL